MSPTVKRVFLALIISLGLLSLSTEGFAAASFDSISFKPSPRQGPYLMVEGAQPIGQWNAGAGVMVQLTNDTVVAKTPAGVTIRDVINEQLATHVTAALGFFDWWDIGVTATFVPMQKFTTATTGVADNGARMGDIRLDSMFRLLDNERYPIGIALVPFITFPTGNDAHLVGNGKITGGGLLVLESPRLWDRFQIALNVGGQARQQVALATGVGIDDQFLFGTGMNVGIVKEVEFIAELTGWTFFDNFFKDGSRNMEFNGGFRFLPWKGLNITVGGGTGILDGIGAPEYRGFLSVAYKGNVSMAQQITQRIVTNNVFFQLDKARIMPASYPTLDNIVSQIKRKGNKIQHVTIEGHTDSTGPAAYNQRLSQRRAIAVLNYLVSKGIKSNLLSAVGKGESDPIASNKTVAGRARNRRVEFHLGLKPGTHYEVIQLDKGPDYPER